MKAFNYNCKIIEGFTRAIQFLVDNELKILFFGNNFKFTAFLFGFNRWRSEWQSSDGNGQSGRVRGTVEQDHSVRRGRMRSHCWCCDR